MPPAVAVVAAGAAAGIATSSIAIGVAVGLGTLALQESLKPELPKMGESADQAQRMITSAISPRRGIYGEVVVSGTMVAYGKLNDYESSNHVVALALAGHQCDSAELFEVNDKLPSATNATSTVYLGDQTSADQTLLTAIPEWTINHIGYNITYAVVTVPVDSETLPSGLNKVTFKVKGRRIYDPRKDSTVGGSGSHRAEDPTTWEWSDNPILCALDYMRFFGYKPLAINRFNLAEIMTEADRCDELVSYTADDGSQQMEKRFTCNGYFNFDEESGSVLQRILSSCMGKPYRRSGRISIKAGGYSGIPTITLTDKDLVGDVQYRPFAPVRERCNAVRATYLEPDAGYTKTEAPVVKNETYRAEDGNYLETSLSLDFTTKSTESQRLQKLYMERKRAGFLAEIEVRSIGLMLTPGSPVRLKLDSDGIDQTFVVEDWRFNPAKKTCSLVLLIDYPEIWTDDIYATVQRPQIVVPDNTTPGSVTSAIFTETPSEAWRVGYLTISGSVTREYNAYSVQIASADGSSRLEKVFTSATNKVSISGLQTGAHGAYIRARASNGRWTPEFFTTFNLTSVYTIGNGKDGTSSAFFNGFESDDDRANVTTIQGTAAFNTDSYSGSTAVLLRNAVASPNSAGYGNTHYLTIPEPLALMFAGQRVSVSVIAKQADTDPSSEFAVAYSTNDVGNSGFQTFTPTADYKKFTFEYDVPLPNAGGTDYLIINADTSASGKGIVVDDIQIVIKGDKGEKGDQGDQGPAPTVVDNGDGSYTITGQNGSITVYDGNNGDDAPIPTITDNGNGTYTIDNGAGDVVTFSDGQDGYSPEKGVDYFDGLNGDYVSFIYKNAASKPATPTGGSFDGTTETFPSGWSDTKQAVPEGQLRWVSTVRYKNNQDGTYTRRTAWKAPAEDFEKGDKGDQGERGITADAIVGRPGQQWGFKDGLQGWALRNGDATYPSGKVRFVGTADDVGMVSPEFAKIPGAENYAIRVRVRTTSADHSTQAELYYSTDSHGQTGNYFKSIPVTFKQDEWIYLVFDMRELTQGGSDYVDSDIKRIRVDFSNHGNNRIYEIDGVVIGYFGAADETDYTDDRISNDVLQPPGIAYGAAGTIYMVKNSDGSLTEGSSSGEIGVSTGAIYLPDNTKIVFGSAMQLATPFEGNFPYKVGFVIASKQATKARFGSGFDQDSYIFTAIYEDGQWKAVDNLATRFAFTPDQNDVVIARIRRNVGGNIEKLESMLTSADITDYSDNRISNDELTQTQIQYGAGWSTMPASGATRNTGALADRNNIDLSNPGSFLLNRLGINYSNLETLNNRLSLGTDGYLTYTDNSGNPVNVGNVTPEGIGASTLDEMLETSAGGNILPDPTFSKFNNSGRGQNYYFSLWGDSGTPRSSVAYNGTDAVWTVKASAQSGPGFNVARLGKLLYIPAKKGDRFAVKVVASSPSAITNFRAYASERLSNLAYNGRTTNFFNVTLNGTRVTLGGIIEVVEDDAAYILLAMRCDIPASDLDITLHSIHLHKMDESFSNDLITIGEDGKLYNGGSQQGQVTADGLGVKTYRVVARGNSSTGVPATPGLYKNGQLVSGIGRSYIVATINRSTGDYTARQTFDVYGSAANAQAMANYLNGLGTDVIVVIYTQDEPQRYRLNNGLDAAMYRCGASRAVFGSSEFKLRSAYALIGIPGCGEGNGAEFYQGEVDNDTNAWLDAGFQIVNGSITGVSGSYTPKTLKDYGFVGDLNANYVDNTNQLTDGAGLGDSALWSGVSGDGRPEDYATDTGISSLIPDPTFDLQKALITGPAPQFYFISNAGEFGDAALAVDGSASRENTTYAWVTRRNGQALKVTARAGDTFKIRARVKNENINAGGLGLNLLPKKSNGDNVGTYPNFFTSGNVPADGNWHTIEATVTIGEDRTTTHHAEIYLYCATNVTSGRFLLDTLEAWKIPASVNNDQVDDAFIKGRFGWNTAPSDGANKTEILEDSIDGRATLHLDGVTKYVDVFSSDSRARWGRLREGKMPANDNLYLNQWGSIFGTGKPSDNANKTEVVTDNTEGRATLHLDGVAEYIDVFSPAERTKLDNLRANKLADGSRYLLDRDLALLNSNGQSTIDSRANNRISALRPDSEYKNSNTTKAQVGLGNVPNYTEAQFNSSAVNAALQEALLRNPSGEGINFFDPLYQNPLNTSLCRDVANGTLSVNSTYDYKQPSRGSVFRLAATAADARFYMARNGNDFPIKLMPGKKWIVSFWVLNNSNVAAFSTNIYFYYPNTTGGFHFQGTSYTTPGAYQSARISCVIDMTATTNDRVYATEACLRLDVDGGAGAALVWDQIMIEPLKDDSAIPSPYTAPYTQAPILRQKALPMVSTAGAGSSSSSNPLSATDDGSTAKINIASHAVQFADGAVNYNSGSVSGLQFNTKYYVYTDDPYYIGGAVTYNAVPAANITDITAGIGRRYLGSITTPSNGGGTSLPPQDECPHAETWLTDSLQAKDVKVGDEIDGVQFGITTPAKVRQVKHTTADCVKITSQSGAQIIVSVTTPIDREDGTSYRAINAAGERVQVEKDGRLEWEPVQKVELLQDQPVVHISLGEISFLGGIKPDSRLVTHNATIKP